MAALEPAVEVDNTDEWSPSQLEALRNAYFATAPNSDQFWRTVARSVPGKSAMQCACKHQETLVDEPEPQALGGAVKGGRGGRQQSKKQPGGEADAARAQLAAAALSKRASKAREQKLRAAGREVRWKRRAEDAGFDGDDVFEAAQPSEALQASLAAAAAATGTARLLVPKAKAVGLLPQRKEALRHEAYVEQTLQRARPKAVPKAAAKAAAKAQAQAPPPPPPPQQRGGVRAMIDTIVATHVPAPAVRDGQSESDEERDDYFSD